jgi:glycosyltransferase involved in cell wall biosynthesis
MKILHLATTTSGGAGIAARRLNSALVESGLDSVLLTGSKSRAEIQPNEEISEKRFLDLVKSKVNTVLQRTFVQKDEFLTTLYSVRGITVEQIFERKPDVVHIHSSYNFIHNDDLLELSSKIPVVITLHDERYLTGACHCTLGCEKFLNTCKNCPQVNRPFQRGVERSKSGKSLFGGASKVLHVICPSEWIQSQVKKSTHSSHVKTYLVRNPISHQMTSKKELRERTANPNENYIVTFVAQNLFNGYKGLDTLLQCIRDYSLEFKTNKVAFKFVGAGPSIDIGDLKIEQKNFAREDEIQEVFYNTDLLIVPSLTDNSPNVIFEALACGVPFVCSDRAGLPELALEFGMNIFKFGDSRSIFEAILMQKSAIVNHHELREHALDKVSPQIVATTMAGIYQEILASS